MHNNKIKNEEFQGILEEHRLKFDRFAELLIEENQKYNLTRIIEPEQIRLRHFIDSMAGLSLMDELSASLKRSLRILDIGSGAGFPGLVLAIIRPQWQIVSLEATEKKVRFQQKVCDEVGLNNVTVINGRAEAMAHEPQYREQFDVITARALAAMPVLAELSLGFLKIDGLACYWKGPGENPQAARHAVEHMGATTEHPLAYSLQTDNDPAHLSLIVCKKIKNTPKEYPRVFGLIKKKPL